MNETVITNGAIYQLLQEMNERLDHIEKRMDRMESKIDRLEDNQMEDRKMLMDLWKDREHVTVKFSRTFLGVNATISAVIAIIISLFVKN